jgi:flagellar basal body-associated protein FliL
MREIWREILEGIDIRILLITLLSIAIILALSLVLAHWFAAINTQKHQQESSIAHPIKNLIQTNFTS